MPSLVMPLEIFLVLEAPRAFVGKALIGRTVGIFAMRSVVVSVSHGLRT